MAEKIISPGVFTNEIDQTFLPAAVADIGAALVGPTLKGPAGIPTIVTSFSDFQAKFGDVFKSGSDSFQFLTSHAAEEYLKNSDTLTVVRIMADGAGGAVSPATAGVFPTGSKARLVDAIDLTGVAASDAFTMTVPAAAGGDGTAHQFLFASSTNVDANEVATTFGISTTTIVDDADAASVVIDAINGTVNAKYKFGANNLADGSFLAAGTLGVRAIQGSSTSKITLEMLTEGTAGNVASVLAANTGFESALLLESTFVGGKDASFTLETLADGTIMNSADTNFKILKNKSPNNILVSGSKHNIRYEVTSKNNKKGTFSLAIRAGNDNEKRKQTLETFNNLSLDPNSTNFITKVIGDQKQTLRTDDGVKYLQLTGSFANASRFVRVKSVDTPTIDYLDENGTIRLNSLSASLPSLGSGSLNGGFSGGADGQSGFDALGNQNGSIAEAVNFYENISSQTQGFNLASDAGATSGSTAYTDALDLLANQDEYDINLILAPGIVGSLHTTIATKIIDVCESRGDCFAIIDPVPYNSTLSAATAQAESRDSNFAAMYWPWIKVPDSQVAGAQRFVPPSTVLGGIYAFNDRVAHPWFAPAGLNRGGITTAIQAERKLTQGNRDDLYDSNVNPIATFPGQGVTVFGQKTLQKKSSALDRINVRRLLIRVKKFVASSSRFLVFEQNTAATRRRFLGIVNPFLEQVQAQSGLSAFRVVMDETNNTPDTIDRNQLVGQLFLQPTRTAEFIVLDFTIQPSGASFPE